MATPEEMQATMIANLPAKTGKELPEWIAIIKESGLEKHGQMVKMLKTDHGMTHGFANLVAHFARGWEPAPKGPDNDLVDGQYSGAKEDLIPIREAVLARVQALGDDVEIAPKKAYISLRRTKQFAILQPSTKTRVDLGLNLKGKEPTERLEAAGSFNSMVSHRVRLTDPGQVDGECEAWLREAYEKA